MQVHLLCKYAIFQSTLALVLGLLARYSSTITIALIYEYEKVLVVLEHSQLTGRCGVKPRLRVLQRRRPIWQTTRAARLGRIHPRRPVWESDTW